MPINWSHERVIDIIEVTIVPQKLAMKTRWRCKGKQSVAFI